MCGFGANQLSESYFTRSYRHKRIPSRTFHIRVAVTRHKRNTNEVNHNAGRCTSFTVAIILWIKSLWLITRELHSKFMSISVPWKSAQRRPYFSYGH